MSDEMIDSGLMYCTAHHGVIECDEDEVQCDFVYSRIPEHNCPPCNGQGTSWTATVRADRVRTAMGRASPAACRRRCSMPAPLRRNDERHRHGLGARVVRRWWTCWRGGHRIDGPFVMVDRWYEDDGEGTGEVHGPDRAAMRVSSAREPDLGNGPDVTDIPRRVPHRHTHHPPS